MQLYSSSSISFTFRQYDCGAGEARLSEWLHLLDAHPNVPSFPHVTLLLGHAGEQPFQASWALQTPGWEKPRHVRERLAAVLGSTEGEHIIQTGPCLGQPGVGWQQTGEGAHLEGGWVCEAAHHLANSSPKMLWGKRVAGKTLVDSGCTWAYQRLREA